MPERLTADISRDLRAPGPWPSIRLLTEAADKLDGLIEALAKAESERDQARADLAEAARVAEIQRDFHGCQIDAAAVRGDEFRDAALMYAADLAEARAEVVRLGKALEVCEYGREPTGESGRLL